MTTRRVLVFDDDSAFIELMQSALEVYAFDIQPLELNPENIQTIKALKPELIFICADLSDNAGYALCSEIRKALVKIFLLFAPLQSSHFTTCLGMRNCDCMRTFISTKGSCPSIASAARSMKKLDWDLASSRLHRNPGQTSNQTPRRRMRLPLRKSPKTVSPKQ